MSQQQQERVLALAGMFQAAYLVQQLAHHGIGNDDAMRGGIQSILSIDAESTIAVYGGLDGVKLGLKNLVDKLDGKNEHADLEIARYVMGMLQLERKLQRGKNLQQAIQQGITNISSQMDFFKTDDQLDYLHPTLIAKLAELYTQTISTLTPRIIVNGDQSYLTSPAIANKIRSALLAGIRSAFLWRQLGGSRLQLLFGRKKILRQARTLLQSNSVSQN